MRDHKPITIAVSNTDGEWLTVEVPWDANAQDMLAAFRTVLFWLGYGNPDDIVPDPWREWGYLDEGDVTKGRQLERSADGLQQSETHIPAEAEGVRWWPPYAAPTDGSADANDTKKRGEEKP